jgi:hypothetical protein
MEGGGRRGTRGDRCLASSRCSSSGVESAASTTAGFARSFLRAPKPSTVAPAATAGTSMNVTGRCHCGIVRYEARLDPAQVTVCHCGDCQMLSGSPYRVSVRVPASAFRLLSGELKSYVKTADSGSKRSHAFCPICGTPVHSSDPDGATSYSLRVGCLDRRSELRPTRQIWCQSSLPWSGDLTDVPGMDRQ